MTPRPREWKVTGVTVTGEAHLARGVPGEDAFGHHVAEDGTALLAVADGVSSASRAREGSALACGAAVSRGARLLAPIIMRSDPRMLERLVRDVLHDVHRRLRAAASTLVEGDAPQAPFASTLAVAAVSGSAAAVGAVGDAFVVGRRADDSLHLLLPPRDAGEFVNTTATIGADRALARARYVMVTDPDLTGIALSTDGLAEACVDDAGTPRQRVHDGLVGAALRHVDGRRTVGELSQTLATHESLREITDDDRTLVLAVRRG
jgi:hypothetical protein